MCEGVHLGEEGSSFGGGIGLVFPRGWNFAFADEVGEGAEGVGEFFAGLFFGFVSDFGVVHPRGFADLDVGVGGDHSGIGFHELGHVDVGEFVPVVGGGDAGDGDDGLGLGGAAKLGFDKEGLLGVGVFGDGVAEGGVADV